MLLHAFGKARLRAGFATQQLIVMKLVVFFTVAFCLNAGANVVAQKITLSERNASLQKVFKEISRQSGYDFFYNNKTLNHTGNVNIQVKDATIEDVLAACFRDKSLSYVIQDKLIIVRTRNENDQPAPVVIEVTGVITDTEGKPLEGVTVTISGSGGKGTTTNAAGVFVLHNVEEGATLRISYVGYATQTVHVNKQTSLTIKMSIEAKVEEMVVVSYGTQAKRKVVGSVAELKASDIADQPTGTFAERLEGKFSGIQVAQTTGRPGQGMEFRVRDAASIGGNNRPLFVIDGIPMLGAPDNINNINPDEIESFTALKDASATALYGSRAANGVIIVTTKRGKSGQTKMDFNAYYGVAASMRELEPRVMNATELATYVKGFYEDKIKYEGYTGGIPVEYQNPEKYGEGTNWYRVLTRTAPVQNYSMSFSNGNDKASISLVGGYFSQEGILKNTGYKRFSLRINTDFNINKNIKIGANVAPSLQLEHNNRQGGGFNIDGQRAIMASALMIPPMGSPYNPDGSLALGIQGFPSLFSWANPLRQLMEIKDDVTKPRLLSNVFTEIKFLRNFTFKSSINTDITVLLRKKWIPSTARGGFNAVPIDNAPPGPKSAYGESSTNSNFTWVNENTLSYQNTFGKDHFVSALLGFTTQRFTDYRNNLTGEDFPDNEIEYLSAATRASAFNSTSEAWSMVSLLSRVNYEYKGRYLLQGAIRRDGSSRFGADNRWGYFPSVGAGWIVSDENFMKNVRPVSFLKLRASYGITGNNEIGNYTAIARIASSNYVFGSTLAPGKAQSSLANSLLSWEKNKQFDAGFDIGLFNNRITLTYDFYRKFTEGLLYPVSVPSASGFTSVQDNVGDIRFWGHEIGINSKNMTGEFNWNSSFNISFNRNKVTRLGINNAPIADAPGTVLSDFTDWRTEVGKPIGMFYGYVFDGVYMNQAEFDAGPKNYSASGILQSRVGTVRMKDLDGDKKITATGDRTFIGNPNPDFIFGFTNNFSYHHFDLTIVLSGTYGNKLKNGMEESLYNLDGAFNGPKELLNRWRSEDDPGNGRIQRTLAGFTTLSRSDMTYFIHDASHITANNITLGYNLKNIARYRFIKNLRVYATVQNAFIITSYPGNPEASSGGLNGSSQGQDFGSYPVPRTYTFGINMSL